MVKILYTLSGEGMGHAIRAKAVIQELQKKHEIMIACGGRAYSFLADSFKNIMFIQDLKIEYRNNKVSNSMTLLRNLRNAPSHIRSIFDLLKAFKKYKPDIIINDFEYLSSYLSFFANIPSIIIDNQQIITKAKIKYPKKFWLDFFNSWIVVKLITPRADYRFITSFFFPKLKTKDAVYCPPIIREEIKKVKPSRGEHILVYQTSDTNDKLIKTLRSFDEKFVVYGFNKNKIQKNIQFKKFNEKSFINDLASSRGAIINGGFCVMTEALYLGKPVLSIPVEKQFEQILNAIYLQRKGYGINAKTANESVIDQFIRSIPKFEKNLKSYPKNNNLFFTQLENKIRELIKVS